MGLAGVNRLWLSEAEIDMLISLYRDPGNPNRVCYCTFENSIDQGMFHNELKLAKQQFIRGPFANFVDWRQCAAVMPSCSGGGNVVVV